MIDTPTNGRATEIGRPAAPLDDVRKPPRDPDDPFKQQLETIMYVPGLFCSENEFETIVAKLADALTTFGADLSSRYRYAKAAVQLKPGGSASAAGFTISKDSPAGPVPLFDVFKLDYEACVVSEYVRAHVLIKALQLILTLRWLAPAIWRTARLGYRKTQSQRNQLIYALGILLGVAFYFGLTFVAIAEIVFTTLTPNKAGGFDFSAATTAFVGWFSKSFPSVTFLVGGPCAVAPLWTGHHYASFVATAASVTGFAMLWSRSALETAYHYAIALPGGLLIAKAPVITLVLTALGLASPRLRSNFENIMNHMLVAIEYFRIGFARNKTTGQFYDLYDDLCKAQDRYARVHVMGYSFGSLVALDALFYTRGATQQRIDRLGDLITIGAPITMAQKFWPKHFDVIRGRFSPGSSHEWINVQCALDVVASPILDRVAGQVVVADTSAGPETEGRPSDWETRRRGEVSRQATAVAADIGDPNNINFSRAINLDYAGWYPLDLDWPEFFSLAALRAHAMYWTSKDEPDYNAFDRIAPELMRALKVRSADRSAR